MASVQNIKTFYESLEENWQKDIFAMKLETVLANVDDGGFPETLPATVSEFTQLTLDEQRALVKEFKIKNQVREWEAAGVDLSEIISK